MTHNASHRQNSFFSIPDIRDLPRGSIFWTTLLLALPALILLFSSS